MVTKKNLATVRGFERMLALAKARAYSKLSLERPLSGFEFAEYKKAMKEALGK
jgi:hypothetical protein